MDIILAESEGVCAKGEISPYYLEVKNTFLYLKIYTYSVSSCGR